MSHFTKLVGADNTGFDPARNLQVLPVGRRTTFYLVAGSDLEVTLDDESGATLTVGAGDDKAAHKSTGLTGWESSQQLRKIVVSAKVAGRETVLRALRNGSDWAQPITIRVVSDQDWRQCGKATAEVTPSLRLELQQLPLRDAVLRIAEDQMNSAIARGSGFGVYHPNPEYNWCGAFVHWCWRQAAAIKGVTNPVGPDSNVLLSPQKAIHWAMRPETPAQLLRYEGTDPMTGTGTQEYREIGYNGYQLERGDVVLLREGGANGWKHVCMVDSVSGTTVGTMNGNQGTGNAIKLVDRSLTELVPGGKPKLVFVHLLT